MSQHDFDIANQTFPSFRSDLNDALQAAATMSAGSSAPTTPYAYQLWFDTTTSTWKVRNSGNTAWISTITTDLATGNVGVGTSSPSVELEIASSAPQMRITDTDTNAVFQINAASTTGGVEIQCDATGVGSNPHMAFDVAGTEAARFDSTQNLLVGKTATGSGTAGVEVKSDGAVYATRTLTTATPVAIFNRLSTDGEIVSFREDSTVVGTIGSDAATYLYIGSDASGANLPSYLRFVTASTPSVRPATQTGANYDAALDLGASGARFQNMYLSDGIYFGTTSSSKYLDDYEEGTFTPVVEDAGGTVLSTSSSSGYYRKIGSVVHMQATLTNINTTGGTSNLSLRMTGHPFTIDSYTAMGALQCSYVTFQGSRTHLTARAVSSEYVDFVVSGSGLGFTYVDVGDIQSGVADIIFSVTYTTTQ